MDGCIEFAILRGIRERGFYIKHLFRASTQKALFVVQNWLYVVGSSLLAISLRRICDGLLYTHDKIGLGGGGLHHKEKSNAIEACPGSTNRPLILALHLSGAASGKDQWPSPRSWRWPDRLRYGLLSTLHTLLERPDDRGIGMGGLQHLSRIGY